MKALEDNPKGVTKADIVVGIPSCNEASVISLPTQQADKGLSKYYPDRQSVIINCDNNSPDNTRGAFMGTATNTPKIYLATEDGVRGKGNNLLNLFGKAVDLSAKAVIVVDADVRTITPLWIRNLAEPLLEDYQYVAPLYVRHKYDGILTSNIVYPMTRALYGRRVRQPIGGEVGFSGELAKVFMESDSWNQVVASFGINIWMTTMAMYSKVSVIQSFLGRPRIHTARDQPTEVGPEFREVLATLFDLMCRYESFWREVKWSRPTAVFGFGVGEVELPPPVEVDTKILWGKLTNGLETYRDAYRRFVHPDNINKLEEVASLPAECFELPTNLWAKILYDFAVAYKKSVMPLEELVEALIPLYYGKTLSFVLETQAMNSQQVEEYIEDQCLQFEKSKPYLLDRWA